MRESQDTATSAALGQLGRSAKDIKVKLSLADVGGPSAGLMFALGIVDKLDGDGAGHDLTGGRTIAGTGTITAGGKVGAVGGVPLKTQAARRDGATVFLVPRKECADARAELPKGLRLVPVTHARRRGGRPEGAADRGQGSALLTPALPLLWHHRSRVPPLPPAPRCPRLTPP